MESIVAHKTYYSGPESESEPDESEEYWLPQIKVTGHSASVKAADES